MAQIQKYLQGLIGIAAFTTSVIGVFLLLAWLTAAPLSLINRSWEKTPGQITRAVVIPKPCGKINQDLELEYSYKFKGESHKGKKLGGAPQYHFFYPDCGASFVKQLSPNLTTETSKPVDVYVNPGNPSEAVLVKGVPPFSKPATWLLLSFVLWGIVWLLRARP